MDAGSILNPGLLDDILQLIENGKSVGCGSTIKMQGLPLWADWTLQLWTGFSILFRWAAGALVVCRSDAFRNVGGFNPELFAADEIALSRLLKNWGPATRVSVQHSVEASAGVVTTQVETLFWRGARVPDPARPAAPASIVARQEALIDLVRWETLTHAW